MNKNYGGTNTLEMGKSEIAVIVAEKLGVSVTELLPNGNEIKYKIKNGTAYHFDTPDEIVTILEEARQSNHSIRLRFCFGDTGTGRDWEEIHDTTGYIGRSTGSIKIPLLIHKVTSSGGPGILDHCIVRIEKKNNGGSYREVYRHPKYHKLNSH
jgi:hypothetical protein